MPRRTLRARASSDAGTRRSRAACPRRDARSQPRGDRLCARRRGYARGRVRVLRLSRRGALDSAHRRSRDRPRDASPLSPPTSCWRSPKARGGRRCDALEAAGVPVAVVPSGSLDAVLEAIGLVGARLGRAEEAKALTDSLVEKREKVRERTASAANRRPRALLLRLAGSSAGRGRRDVPRRRAPRGRCRERRRQPARMAYALEGIPRDAPRSTSSSCRIRRRRAPPTGRPSRAGRSRAVRSRARRSCGSTRRR